MSNTKTVMSQAANTQGLPLDITDVFSTYLYTGNGSTQTITNDIDLDGEGGLVWFKSRDNSTFANSPHVLTDSVTGFDKYLISNQTVQQQSWSTDGPVPASDGFSLLANASVPYTNYLTGSNYASWTFRKAPKFFDVVTYTGTGTAQAIAHNLGGTVGSIIIKRTDTTSNWAVYHHANTVAPETDYLSLNLTNATTDDATFWNDTAPTSTQFTVGTNAVVNASGGTYVAYLFAHNDGDGGFGPSGGQDIIKCGSYTGNGSTDGPEIDLGFEPQWVIIKSTTATQNWDMYDSMRGVTGSSSDPRLVADQSSAEITGFEGPQFNATGFKMVGTAISNANGKNYIYIAIRRGPLAPPESGTEVFAIDTKTTPEPAYNSGFVVDMAIQRNISVATSNATTSRLIQKKRLLTDSTAAEENSVTFMFDYNTGYSSDANNNASVYSWMWKRAPSFFDVVAYTGDGVAGLNVSHNLGVAPEMIWVKRRNSTGEWPVYHKDLSLGNRGLVLQGSFGTYASEYWNSQNPTSTTFPLGIGSSVNSSGSTYIAYLFATLAGVSKVGSYTGNGTSQTIDCGFTSGARFILIKRTDSTGDWYVWDTERGIVAGNDPHLSLNTTAAEVTSDDSIDPDNSGFIVNQVGATNINVSSAEYIFYAVA